MSQIHPHWQSTDEDERVVHIHAAEPATQTVSRRPAAIFGIALSLLIGTVVFTGLRGMYAQITTEKKTVRITAEGLSPVVITVAPGETILWINEDSIPHLLASETLTESNGEPFAPPAIFPSNEYEFVVPATAPGGTHTYISQTSSDISGQIVITGTSAGPAAVTRVTTPTPIVPTTSATPEEIIAQPTPTVRDSDAQILNPAAIPVNPYTVGSNPLPAGSNRAASVTQHRPATQPNSGSGLWVTVIGAILGMTFLTRRYFASV